MTPTPHELAAELERLSGEFSALTEEASKLDMARPLALLEYRATVKTNAEAQNLFDASPNGQRLTYLKWMLSAKSSRMSALKTVLRNFENEARNLH